MSADGDDLRARVRGIAEDLVQLEVNTIVKPRIAGTKMPPLRHALIDIGRDYYRCLLDICGTVEGIDEERLGSYYAFDRMRTVAKTALIDAEASGAPADAGWHLLQRVKDTADNVKGVLEAGRTRGDEGWHNDYSRAEIQGQIDPAPRVVWATYPPRVPDTVRQLPAGVTPVTIAVTNVDREPLDVYLVRAPSAGEAPATADGQLLLDELERVALAQDIRPLETKALIAASESVTSPLPSGRYLLAADRGPIALDLRVEPFKPPPPLELTSEDARVIRKAWELGVEEIAMQTVIYLDGDVVTRLQPQYARTEDPLRDVHQRGVSVAVGFWRDLVGIATELLGTAVGTLTGRR